VHKESKKLASSLYLKPTSIHN